MPDLPEWAQWPVYLGPPVPDARWEALKGEPLGFLMQVNLSEVAPFDVAGLLPTSGMLYFFYTEANRRFNLYPHFGEDVLNIRYSPQERECRRASPPHNLPPEEIYRGFALTPYLEWTVPLYEDLLEEIKREGILDQPEIDAGLDHWDDLTEEIADLQGLGSWYRPKHRMLGYPDFFQAGGCGPGDWKLLLQVDSDPRFSVPSPYDDPNYPGPGMMWGDSGRIYFGIEQGELAAKDFSAVWAIFESH